MAKTFHLAIPVGDLDKAIGFYCNVLGCKKGILKRHFSKPIT